MTSAAKDQPTAPGEGKKTGQYNHAVGELRIAAQEWHPSETRETSLSRFMGKQMAFDNHL